MITVSIKPREIRLLPRGNWLDDSGPIMSPAVPEFLGQIRTDGKRATRLDLANWLVDLKTGCWWSDRARHGKSDLVPVDGGWNLAIPG